MLSKYMYPGVGVTVKYLMIEKFVKTALLFNVTCHKTNVAKLSSYT